MVILFFSDMADLVGEVKALEICFELVFLLNLVIGQEPTGQTEEILLSLSFCHWRNVSAGTTMLLGKGWKQFYLLL